MAWAVQNFKQRVILFVDFFNPCEKLASKVKWSFQGKSHVGLTTRVVDIETYNMILKLQKISCDIISAYFMIIFGKSHNTFSFLQNQNEKDYTPLI